MPRELDDRHGTRAQEVSSISEESTDPHEGFIVRMVMKGDLGLMDSISSNVGVWLRPLLVDHQSRIRSRPRLSCRRNSSLAYDWGSRWSSRLIRFT